jgi:methylmalonyl-CoA mutase
MPEETSKQNGDAPSFDEFDIPTYEEWYETAVKSLKGAAFEKKLITRTYEDIDLHPLYRQEDAADIAHQHTLPGHPPYVRGIQAEGYLQKGWDVAQEIQASTPAAFNAALLYDMARGQTAVNLVLDQPSHTGYDPDQSEQVGRDGVSIATSDDLAHALYGVDLSTTPIFVRVGASGLPFLSLLVAVQKGDVQTLSGCIESDPLGEIIQYETLPLTLEQAYDELAKLTIWAAENAPNLDTVAVHSMPYHNAGASAVQELAFALSTGVEYLRAMIERGIEINTAAGKMRFMFAVGANFFMEVAKLRAARLLWSQIVAAFGGDEDAQKMKQHARTATYNKPFYDPYVNMLRTTIEGMAGAVGGMLT